MGKKHEKARTQIAINYMSPKCLYRTFFLFSVVVFNTIHHKKKDTFHWNTNTNTYMNIRNIWCVDILVDDTYYLGGKKRKSWCFSILSSMCLYCQHFTSSDSIIGDLLNESQYFFCTRIRFLFPQQFTFVHLRHSRKYVKMFL